MNPASRRLLVNTLVGLDRVEAMFGNRTPERGRPPSQVREILVWTMDQIGDVQRMTPLLRLLRERWATARLSVVVAGRAAPVLVNNPHINALHVVRTPYSIGEHLELLRRLRRTRWDVGVLAEVDFFWAKLGSWCFRLLGIPYGAGFDLGAQLPRPILRLPLREGGSWIDQFVGLANALGAGGEAGPTEFFLTDAERSWAREFLALHGLAKDAPFFLIHPGGNFNTVSRQWPATRYAELVRLLRRNWPHPIIVTGTDDERRTSEQIAARAGPPLIDLCGALSLRQLAAVIECAALCIMNDTGPLHIAHALGRKTVVILGPTAPEVVGLSGTARAVYAELACRPCAFLQGWRACANPVQWQCLDLVSPEAVLNAIRAQMDECLAESQKN